MCIRQSDDSRASRKARTLTLTEDERYAAVFALLSEVDSLNESVAHEIDVFKNSSPDRWALHAQDVTDLMRSVTRLVPVLDLLTGNQA